VSSPNVEPGKKPLQCTSVESFCEDVCTILCLRVEDYIDLLLHDHLAHKVKSDLYVLRATVEDWVLCNGYATMAVTIQHG